MISGEEKHKFENKIDKVDSFSSSLEILVLQQLVKKAKKGPARLGLYSHHWPVLWPSRPTPQHAGALAPSQALSLMLGFLCWEATTWFSTLAPISLTSSSVLFPSSLHGMGSICFVAWIAGCLPAKAIIIFPYFLSFPHVWALVWQPKCLHLVSSSARLPLAQ